MALGNFSINSKLNKVTSEQAAETRPSPDELLRTNGTGGEQAVTAEGAEGAC
jgi:hypothetical protein